MSGVLDKPTHWIERAEEARTIAEDLTDPVSKKMMLDIAEGYDRLAKRAAERYARAQPQPQPRA